MDYVSLQTLLIFRCPPPPWHDLKYLTVKKICLRFKYQGYFNCDNRDSSDRLDELKEKLGKENIEHFLNTKNKQTSH